MLMQLYWRGPGEYDYVTEAMFCERYRATEAGKGFLESLALPPEQETRGHGQLAVHK
jgi:hypothetical protein